MGLLDFILPSGDTSQESNSDQRSTTDNAVNYGMKDFDWSNSRDIKSNRITIEGVNPTTVESMLTQAYKTNDQTAELAELMMRFQGESTTHMFDSLNRTTATAIDSIDSIARTNTGTETKQTANLNIIGILVIGAIMLFTFSPPGRRRKAAA